MRTCSVAGCGRPVLARGWCKAHWRYAQRRDWSTPTHLIGEAPKRPLTRNLGACSVAGCDTKAFARGWCLRHYSRWHRHGDPTFVPPPRPAKTVRVPVMRPTIEERIRAGSAPQPNGCIRWTGVHDQDGYGIIKFRGKGWRVHRLVWTLAFGPIPAGLAIDHECDVRDCLALPHLAAMSPAANSTRAWAKRRVAAALGLRPLVPPRQPRPKPEPTPCRVANCDRMAETKGLCHRCHLWSNRHGGAEPPPVPTYGNAQ